jgi:hypothetical protein
VLEVGLDLVDHLEAAKRFVGLGGFLAIEEGRAVVQEDGAVAPLLNSFENYCYCNCDGNGYR